MTAPRISTTVGESAHPDRLGQWEYAVYEGNYVVETRGGYTSADEARDHGTTAERHYRRRVGATSAEVLEERTNLAGWRDIPNHHARPDEAEEVRP